MSNEDDDILYLEPVTIYRGSYLPRFSHELLQHMAQGKSLKSFAGRIGVSPSTLANWEEKHEDFAEAVSIAKAVALGKWEDIAIDQATGMSKGQASTLTFMMKNLFPEDYKDKVNIEQEGNISFVIDTGIPTHAPEGALDITTINADYSKIEDEDEGWESPDEELL